MDGGSGNRDNAGEVGRGRIRRPADGAARVSLERPDAAARPGREVRHEASASSSSASPAQSPAAQSPSVAQSAPSRGTGQAGARRSVPTRKVPVEPVSPQPQSQQPQPSQRAARPRRLRRDEIEDERPRAAPPAMDPSPPLRERRRTLSDAQKAEAKKRAPFVSEFDLPEATPEPAHRPPVARVRAPEQARSGQRAPQPAPAGLPAPAAKSKPAAQPAQTPKIKRSPAVSPDPAAPPQAPRKAKRSTQPEPQRAKQRAPRPPKAPAGGVLEGPLVPADSLARAGLTAVVAIMTFMSACLVGAALIVAAAGGAWSASVLDEITVTVLPLDGDPIEWRLDTVAEVLQRTDGLSAVSVRPAAESEALLEPWLGEGDLLAVLPVPRLVTARRDGPVNVDALNLALAEVPGATLDDHEGWNARLAAMSRTATLVALATVALMVVATALSVVFATRSAIAANTVTIEVLSLLGAGDKAIARAFSGHFFAVGVRGAALGIAGAAALFGVLEVMALFNPLSGSAQSVALFGVPRIGFAGFAALGLIAIGMAVMVWLTARHSVLRHLISTRP